jgi:hypothetical protein
MRTRDDGPRDRREVRDGQTGERVRGKRKKLLIYKYNINTGIKHGINVYREVISTNTNMERE